MDESSFFVTGPGDTDGTLIGVAIALFLIVLGFGALYFTIQAWPDRLVKGAGKVQFQIVGLLGLISLVTLNNAYWIAALLVAAIRIPDFITPLRAIASSLKKQEGDEEVVDTSLKEQEGDEEVVDASLKKQKGDEEVVDD